MIYRSIILSGPVAAGTSTAAVTLALKLGLDYKSAGDFFRQYIIDHNIPLPEKTQIPDEVDRKIDRELTDLAASDKSVVIDSLYHGYFTRNMPHVLKVLLTADQETRIKRALARTHTHKETREDVIRRDQTHDIKFRKLYADENFLDPKFFDLVIDTTKTSKEETINKILEKFKEN